MKLFIILTGAVLLVGCSSHDGSNADASNNGLGTTIQKNACIFNAQLNQYTVSTGDSCSAQPMIIKCPAIGNYTNQYGQPSACSPGSLNLKASYTYSGQYPNLVFMNQTSCDQFLLHTGIQHIPVVLNGQLQCVRLDVVEVYANGTAYSHNYDYYYAFPPYSYSGTGSCGTQVTVSLAGYNGPMCF